MKQIIGDAVKALDRKEYIRYVNIAFDGFGDNSIDFKVLAWVDSRKQTWAKSDMLEAIYNALNEHGIEIPYPQRDLHIVSDKTREVRFVDSVEEAMRNTTDEDKNVK